VCARTRGPPSLTSLLQDKKVKIGELVELSIEGEVRKNREKGSVSRIQEKEKRGEMITKNDNIK
jgi:hypothetical protein